MKGELLQNILTNIVEFSAQQKIKFTVILTLYTV